jgi:hypothetical protein
MKQGIFERMMEPKAWGEGVSAPGLCARQATLDVADTVYLCAMWWQQYGGELRPTPRDLLFMAELIMRREDRLEAEGWPGDESKDWPEMREIRRAKPP